ncbi:MAG: fibronectin type III domain-containing protein, partial [Patescibacteria group bacterium]
MNMKSMARFFLLTIIFFIASTASADITTGLVSRFSFEEVSGTSVADTSGNYRTGIITGGASRTASTPTSLTASTQSIVLDGVDDEVKTVNTVSMSTLFSAGAWVYRTSGGGGVVRTQYNDSFALYLNAGGLVVWQIDGNPYFSTGVVPLNTWTHVFGTWDGTNAKIYINGALDVNSGDVSGVMTLSSTNYPITVGSVFDGPVTLFTGRIDEVRVYSRGLSGSDVTELYNDTGVIPPDSIPPVISAVASSTSISSATVTWTTNEGATSTVNYGLTTGYGSASTSATLATSHSIVLSGLTSSTLYHFQVSSTDANGNRSTSTDYTFTTATPDLTAPVISSIASTTATTTATITWTTDDLSDTQVEYGATASYGNTTTLDSTATTSHRVVITGLTSGATYHYRVLSRNGTAVLASSTDKTFVVATPGPTAPTYVGAKGVASDQINLVWHRSIDLDGTITSYKVYRNGVLIATLNPVTYIAPYEDTSVNYYQDRDVGPNTAYNYYIVARDSLGLDSPISATVTGTTTSGSQELIPTIRRTDWEPGVTVGVTGGIDQYISGRTNLIDVTQSPYNADDTGATDASAAIQAAINAAGNGDVVYMPAGTYRLENSLYAQNKSNFTLRGAGRDQTFIDAISGSISLRGTGVEILYPIAPVLSGAYKGSTEFTVADVSSYNVGDMVFINTLNDFDLPVIAPNGGSRLRTQMSRITAVSSGSNTISIFPAVIQDVHPTETTVMAIPSVQMVSNVGLEDFSFDASNGAVQVGITLDGIYNSWVKGVKVSGVSNYGIRVASSLKCEIRYSEVEFASVGSNKAGLLSGNMNSCLIEDNAFIDAFPVIEINGSVGNVISYNYMIGSSNTNHGPYSDYNLYEGNYAQEFKSDGYYGGEGNATYFRNYVSGFFVGKRFSRNFNYIGNIATNYSFGQPNIGNGSSDGFALQSQGQYWKDWNPTDGPTIAGTFTKASSTAGSINIDSHENAVRMFEYMQDLGCTGTATVMVGCYHPASLDWGYGRDDDQFRWTIATAIDLTTDTIQLSVLYPSGVALPNSGTYAGLWPRSEGLQELDMEVNLTSIRKNNYIVDGIPAMEALSNGETVPDSLYYDSKPGWFYNLNWPAFDPSQPTPTAASIPAGYRYLNNGLDPGGVDSTPPSISSIASSTSVTNATVTWTTNESSNSRVAYGTVSGTYSTTAVSGTMTTSHTTNLTGLTANTVYYFVVSSTDSSGNAATSSERTFRTTTTDTTSPTISSIASSTTNTTATITWTTNETASSSLAYGVTTAYGATSSSGSFVTSHSVSLTSLSPSTTYNYRIHVYDSSGNLTSSSNLTFTTTSGVDTTAPLITNIATSSTDTTSTITWTSNESASSSLLYGTTTSYGATSSSATLTTSHSVTLTSLTPSTTYNYK